MSKRKSEITDVGELFDSRKLHTGVSCMWNTCVRDAEFGVALLDIEGTVVDVQYICREHAERDLAFRPNLMTSLF